MSVNKSDDIFHTTLVSVEIREDSKELSDQFEDLSCFLFISCIQ